MASEIRVDKINSLSGVGTVTLSPTGVDIAGITTAATLRATTGIVTSLTAVSSAKVGSGVTLSPDGDVFATGVCTATSFVGNGSGLTNLATDLVNDTSPQLGGDLDTNDFEILFDDAHAAKFGNSSQFQIKHDGSGGDARLINTVGNLYSINSTNGWIILQPVSGQTGINVKPNAAVELMHSGNKKIETTSSGATVTGNLAFASAGQGIDFSAAGNAGGMTSELLDDYEEGTFTPNWDGSGGVTFSYNHQYGWYSKIGNTVTFQLYIQGYASTITGGNENNALALQGLPFTILDHARYYPSFSIGRTYKFDIEAAERLYAYGDPNTTNGRFIKESDDAAGTLLVAQDLNQNTTVVHLSGVYRTDS